VSECRRCKRALEDAAWTALPILARLEQKDLGDLLSEWPWSRDAVLEVRACKCGETVSRVVR